MKISPAFLILLAAAGIPQLTHAADDLSLFAKATLFDLDTAERFIVNRQVAPKLRLPAPDRPYFTYNMPDNAYMTGLWCAAQSWRYALTGSPEAKRLAREAFHGMNHLIDVTGEPGLLARASMPADMPRLDDGDWRPSPDGKFVWRGDVSSDQVDGVIFGYYVYSTTVAAESELPLLAEKVSALVGRILDHKLTIRDSNGQVTMWGRYDAEYVRTREPMNALLMLQMLKVAAAATGQERFAAEYRRLALDEGYAPLAERSRYAQPPEEVNHSDDVLIAIALHPLLDLEKDPALRAHYLKAADCWWNGAEGHPGVSAEANPLFSFLYERWTGDASAQAAAVETLRRAPLDMKWNRATIAAYEKRFGFKFDPAPESPESEAALIPPPIDRREKTWSFLVANPYTSAGGRTAETDMEYQGVDYSLSYWFGAAHGMVPEDALPSEADRRRRASGDSPKP